MLLVVLFCSTAQQRGSSQVFETISNAGYFEASLLDFLCRTKHKSHNTNISTHNDLADNSTNIKLQKTLCIIKYNSNKYPSHFTKSS